MQRTVREAKEQAYGCNCGEMEGEHDHDQETGQPVAKPTRMSTMEKTAQEGIQYLKDQRKDTLLEVQGLAPRGNRNKADAGSDSEEDDEDNDDEDDDTTEHTGGVGEEDDDDDEPLTGENGHDDDSNSGGPGKMAKQRTMLATAKEGHDLLENYMGGKPDANARTRAQQKTHEQDEDEDEDSGPDAKKPRRTHTMQETAQEAQQLLADPHSIGGTRSETAAVKKAGEEASPKRQRKQ